jgi:Protein of unknown function (DUF3306)
VNEAKSYLSRWSQRKLAARRGDVVDEPPAPAGEPAAVEPAEPVIEPEAPVLPSVDELDFQSDYTAFLAKNVPEALRRAALRKLWTSDPVLANLDGLNDYDEDYQLVDTAITAAQTAYKAGRGYLVEVEKKLERIDEAIDGTGGAPPESPGDAAPAGGAASGDTLSDNDAAVGQSADAEQQVAAVPGPDSNDSGEEPGK